MRYRQNAKGDIIYGPPVSLSHIYCGFALFILRILVTAMF